MLYMISQPSLIILIQHIRGAVKNYGLISIGYLLKYSILITLDALLTSVNYIEFPPSTKHVFLLSIANITRISL